MLPSGGMDFAFSAWTPDAIASGSGSGQDLISSVNLRNSERLQAVQVETIKYTVGGKGLTSLRR